MGGLLLMYSVMPTSFSVVYGVSSSLGRFADGGSPFDMASLSLDRILAKKGRSLDAVYVKREGIKKMVDHFY